MDVKTMSILTILVLAAAIIGSQSLGYAAEEPGRLYAGTAKVDITPSEEIATDLVGKKLKIFENLYARALVLKTDETSLAIVSLDLILFGSAKVVAEAKAKWGVDHVILSSTHTHAAMAPEGLILTPRARGGDRLDWTRAGNPEDFVDWPSLSEDPWYAETEEKIVAAIGEASRNLFPARIVAGTAPYESVYLGSNRRYVTPDGTGRNRWGNPDRLPTEPRDPTIRVIRVEDEAGNPRVLLVHYACHPAMTGGAGYTSADYPGAMADYIEKELGTDCMAMFLQGAAGDQDPYDLNVADGHLRIALYRQAGIALGKAALRVSKNMPSPRGADTNIRIEESMVPIAYRDGKGSTKACVMTVLINDNLAMVTIPGEALVQHQLNLADGSPVPNTLLLGYAYSGRGCPFLIYVPTEKAAREGGYSATECVFVEGAAGRNMVNAGLACITHLLEN